MKTATFFITLVTTIIIATSVVHAAEGIASPEAPIAASEAVANPSTLVNTIYKIALLVGGLLAFGGIVYGAVLYSVAGGNTSRQHEAREQITQALLGLLLLFATYLIVALVNPGLADNLSLPPLFKLKPPEIVGVKQCGGNQWGDCRPGTCVRGAGGTYSCITTTASTHPAQGYGCQAGRVLYCTTKLPADPKIPCAEIADKCPNACSPDSRCMIQVPNTRP